MVLSLASDVCPALQDGSDRQQCLCLRRCVSILGDRR